MDFLEGKVEILDDVLVGKAGSRDLLADLFPVSYTHLTLPTIFRV